MLFLHTNPRGSNIGLWQQNHQSLMTSDLKINKQIVASTLAAQNPHCQIHGEDKHKMEHYTQRMNVIK